MDCHGRKRRGSTRPVAAASPCCLSLTSPRHQPIVTANWFKDRSFGCDASTLGFFMPGRPSPEVELLRAAYAAFNARGFDAAFATMAPDVAWPRAFKGGFVRGHEEVRAYWTEQWAEIDTHVGHNRCDSRRRPARD